MEKPIVRHFMACREIIVDSENGNITLKDLIHAIVPMEGGTYPVARDLMALYCLLTNGRGFHEIALELSRFDRGQEIRIHRTAGKRVDLGSDPVEVRGLFIPLKNVAFPEPGQYTFHLLCDGDTIAEEKILLREA